MKILIIIPARGGSKRIPRKNVRIMCGRPLINYSIENAKAIRGTFDADIAVSTDDDELSHIVSKQGVDVINRPAELATDKVTLDPVIFNALQQMEQKYGRKYDIVITMQPTSPTLRYTTVLEAIQCFQTGGWDTIISATNKPHLSWAEEKGQVVKNYKERLNSQDLPKNYLETGGFVITRRELVTVNNRIGKKMNIYEIDSKEAVDIDSEEDWVVSESILKRKTILFRTKGYLEIGMGHIYRCLTFAYRLIGHDLLFVLDSKSDMGIKKIEESFFPMQIIENEEGFEEVLKEWKPDIVVNDILDTEEDYMKMIRKYTKRIVNFEDLGPGTRFADAVVNALYESQDKPANVYDGLRYFCIRDEFLEETPKTFRETVENVMIIFGGADPADLTGRLYNICKELHEKYPLIEFHFITGFAYMHKDKIKTDEESRIFIHNDVKRVSAFMSQSDLAITSQGRTIFELASMGVPAVVLAQNEREAEHVFASIQNGFINLGLGSEQDDMTIIQTIEWMIATPKVRKEMRKLQLNKEFVNGQQRVIKLILGN